MNTSLWQEGFFYSYDAEGKRHICAFDGIPHQICMKAQTRKHGRLQANAVSERRGVLEYYYFYSTSLISSLL